MEIVKQWIEDRPEEVRPASMRGWVPARVIPAHSVVVVECTGWGRNGLGGAPPHMGRKLLEFPVGTPQPEIIARAQRASDEDIACWKAGD